MIATTATAWCACTSPDTPAASHATVQTRPTAAITRLRRRYSTSRSTTNCASTIAAVLAARATPSIAGEMCVTVTANAESPDSNCP